jgi:hypothetical protein
MANLPDRVPAPLSRAQYVRTFHSRPRRGQRVALLPWADDPIAPIPYVLTARGRRVGASLNRFDALRTAPVDNHTL